MDNVPSCIALVKAISCSARESSAAGSTSDGLPTKDVPCVTSVAVLLLTTHDSLIASSYAMFGYLVSTACTSSLSTIAVQYFAFATSTNGT